MFVAMNGWGGVKASRVPQFTELGLNRAQYLAPLGGVLVQHLNNLPTLLLRHLEQHHD
jgi:hypothetical protein